MKIIAYLKKDDTIKVVNKKLRKWEARGKWNIDQQRRQTVKITTVFLPKKLWHKQRSKFQTMAKPNGPHTSILRFKFAQGYLLLKLFKSYK